MAVTKDDIKKAVESALAQTKHWLVVIASLGVAVLLVGWLAQRYGITIIRIPSAEPTQLVYAAGIIWLLK